VWELNVKEGDWKHPLFWCKREYFKPYHKQAVTWGLMSMFIPRFLHSQIKGICPKLMSLIVMLGGAHDVKPFNLYRETLECYSICDVKGRGVRS
jgi:hypothetical protein